MPRLKPPPSKPVDPVEEVDTLIDAPIEIELPDEPGGPTEVSLAPEPAPKSEPPPQDDQNQLASQLAAQQRAEELQRQNAELQRQNAEHEARLREERVRGDDAEYNSVLTAIAAEQAVLDKAEQDYAGYASMGDFANAAKAQRLMAQSAARLDRLEDGKVAFEQKREARTKEPPPAPAPPQLSFEQRIQSLPETAKAWLRKHPEFINDQEMNAKIGAAHSYLTKNKGIEGFSPAYFDALDEEFGFKTTPPATTEPSQPARRSMPVSAPVSRDVPSANGQRPTSSSKMTLTEEERRIARTSFTAPDMTNAQKELLYAQNKRRLQTMRANGQYPQPERN